MSLGTYTKNSLAKRAYPCYLNNISTLTVSNLSGAGDPVGLTVHSVTYDSSLRQVIELISGGTVGVTYEVTIQFDLSNGEHVVYVFEIKVQDG